MHPLQEDEAANQTQTSCPRVLPFAIYDEDGLCASVANEPEARLDFGSLACVLVHRDNTRDLTEEVDSLAIYHEDGLCASVANEPQARLDFGRLACLLVHRDNTRDPTNEEVDSVDS